MNINEWIKSNWHGMDSGSALDAVAGLRAFMELHPKTTDPEYGDYCGTCHSSPGVWPCVSVAYVTGAMGGSA